MLTQEYLQSILHYAPESGVFTWIKTSKAGWVGKTAGCIRLHPNCKKTQNKLHYLVIHILGKLYKAHRLAWLYMTGKFPEGLIDHEDGNGLNNKFSNLRPATVFTNNQNSVRPITNSSGYKGVYPHKKNGTWIAQITYNKVQHYLGSFATPEAASEAVRAKRIELHGEFANHG